MELQRRRDGLLMMVERASDLGFPCLAEERELEQINEELKKWESLENGETDRRKESETGTRFQNQR